jgi:hypothetical protein
MIPTRSVPCERSTETSETSSNKTAASTVAFARCSAYLRCVAQQYTRCSRHCQTQHTSRRRPALSFRSIPRSPAFSRSYALLLFRAPCTRPCGHRRTLTDIIRVYSRAPLGGVARLCDAGPAAASADTIKVPYERSIKHVRADVSWTSATHAHLSRGNEYGAARRTLGLRSKCRGCAPWHSNFGTI